jgi:hypothetical protein
MLRALPSNGRCLQSHHLATGLHATILTNKKEYNDQLQKYNTKNMNSNKRALIHFFFYLNYDLTQL